MSYYCGFYERLERNWAWVVLLASFFNQFISNGIGFSLGIYNVEFLEAFEDTKANTAWVSSIHLAFLLGSGPIVAYVMDRTSGRLIACLGVAISTTGVILTAFATELFHLYITIGIIMGVGASMVYMPSVVLVGLYFTKYHTFATSITTGGGAIGSIIFPPLFTHIIEKYTWRGSMFIIAAFCAQMMVFSALLRPLDSEPDTELDPLDKDKQLQTGVQHDYPDRVAGDTMKTSEIAGLLISRVENTESDQPLVDLIIVKSNEDVMDNHIKGALHEYDEGHNSSEMLRSIDNGHNQINGREHSHSCDQIVLHDNQSHERESLILHTDHVLADIAETNIDIKQLSQRSSKYSEKPNLSGKTEAMGKDFNQLEDSPRRRCSESQQRSSVWTRNNVMKRRLSSNILCDVDFLIFLFNNIFWSVGGCIVIVMTADYIYVMGAEKSQIAVVITVAGFGDILGTCLASAIGDWKYCNRALVYSILCIINGIITGLFLVASDLITIGAFCSLSGFTIGWFMSWTVSITTDLVGPSKLGEAFGYLMLANGAGSLAGPPFGGWLFDMTGDYTATFLAAGSIISASGLLMLIIPLKKICRWKGLKQYFRGH